MVQAGVAPYQTAPGFPPAQQVGADLSAVAVAVKSGNDPLAALKLEGLPQQSSITSGPPQSSPQQGSQFSPPTSVPTSLSLSLPVTTVGGITNGIEQQPPVSIVSISGKWNIIRHSLNVFPIINCS